jgi:hypothetical protein
MTSNLVPLRNLPALAQYKPGDVLVVFGELFSRGYANGIVEEAERAGLTIIRSTVGRRDENGMLRPLTSEELAAQPQPFINIPLEAGFDLEPCSQDGSTPVDQLAGVKLSGWENVQLDWEKIRDSRERGSARFREQVKNYLSALDAHIPKGANVLFVHTMAGGVPRAKIIMPMMNRVFKGTGDRHVPSEQFWTSQLGRLAEMNFEEVTANTLAHLIEQSAGLRSRLQKEGGSARYVAYGYHGTEVLIDGNYKWQTYTPYIQGWAKRHLEDIARDSFAKGIPTTVYNCPEILTNSSSIFVGVEVPLYPFTKALERESKGQPFEKEIRAVLDKCRNLLKPEVSFDSMVEITNRTMTSDHFLRHNDFAKWPQHNSKEQMEELIAASESLVDIHLDTKNLITFVLSEEIFRATGSIMFHDSWQPQAPVLWLGHDILAKTLAVRGGGSGLAN